MGTKPSFTKFKEVKKAQNRDKIPGFLFKETKRAVIGKIPYFPRVRGDGIFVEIFSRGLKSLY